LTLKGIRNKLPRSKRSQEEMIGFVLIIIIVSVILLILLGFSLRNPDDSAVDSYEVKDFIHSFLQYTTDCQDSGNFEYLSINKLLFRCYNNEQCADQRNSCDVLETDLREIIQESWQIGENRPLKAYELRIISYEEEIIKLEQGNITSTSRGAIQELPKEIKITFRVYS